ncbi:MAG: 16S rRNA (cytosine(967)-C(5))-methyltransferase RsmB, partial [Pseudomonadota bacterium]
QACAAALEAVRAGRSLTATLDAVDSKLRPGVQALSFHVLRWLGCAEALRHQLARRAPPPPADALLCTALALACGQEGEAAPYETFTLVDQAVEAAKRTASTRPQANFINACLRRFLRDREALLAVALRDPVAQWNHPRWWIAQIKSDHPQHWQAILQANNTRAPMTLRINVRKVAPADYLQALADAGLQVAQHAPGSSTVVLARPCAVQKLPGFAEGWVSVQDAAAQMAAPLLLGDAPLSAKPRVLDACAAPGGKTAHLLEIADAQVTAIDVDAKRCERIHQNLQRLGLWADVRAADAGRPETWWNGQPFDAILLDAPCTASGIVRRHPDVRWLRRESDIAQLAALQAQLLNTLWPLLRPGGRLLYATCSVFRAEGDGQIETFVARNTDACHRPSPGHLLPQSGAGGGLFPDNAQGDHDGFYYALLEKHSS